MKNSELIKVLMICLNEDGDMDIVLPQCGEDKEGINMNWMAEVSMIEVQVKNDGSRVLSIF